MTRLTDQVWSGRAAPRRTERWRSLAPAALLVAIAAVGVVRSITLDQSSWQGASFGMFATYESSRSRVVQVRVHGAGGEVVVQLPEDLADDGERLEVVPTDGAAQRLAAAVLHRLPPAGGQRVLVEVWGLRVIRDEDDRLRATRHRLAKAGAGP